MCLAQGPQRSDAGEARTSPVLVFHSLCVVVKTLARLQRGRLVRTFIGSLGDKNRAAHIQHISFNRSLDIHVTWSYHGSHFLHLILHRNYRKITINGNFPIIPLKNCPFITRFTYKWPIHMDPKHVIKVLHSPKSCAGLFIRWELLGYLCYKEG